MGSMNFMGLLLTRSIFECVVMGHHSINDSHSDLPAVFKPCDCVHLEFNVHKTFHAFKDISSEFTGSLLFILNPWI